MNINLTSFGTNSEINKSNEKVNKITFSNTDINYYLNLYQKSLQKNVINFYQYLDTSAKLYSNTVNQIYENIKDLPNRLPANGHDVYNYIARYGIGNYQIQAILNLDGKLDINKLYKAVKLSLIAEPIFTCRFIEADPPFWKRPLDTDLTLFCSIEETKNLEESIQNFLESPLDMDNDPMVKIKLIRSQEYDTLGIKINHACCDGTGAKEYIKLLSDIYSSIDDVNNVALPKPNIRSRKDQDKLFHGLGIYNPNSAFIPGSDITLPTWSFPWQLGRTDNARVTTCRFPNNFMSLINNYSKIMKATINDLVLTALYRSLPKMGQPIYNVPMQIPVTVDLRRFLPNNKTESIRNFSGSVNTLLSIVENESFNETLSRVVTMMKEIKNDRPGIQSAIGLERVEKMTIGETRSYFQVSSFRPPYGGDKCLPVLTNFGYISKSLLKFGNTIVTDAYMVSPAVRAPGLLIVVNTYNNIITLAISYYDGSIKREDTEKLLGKIKDELIEGCRL